MGASGVHGGGSYGETCARVKPSRVERRSSLVLVELHFLKRNRRSSFASSEYRKGAASLQAHRCQFAQQHDALARHQPEAASSRAFPPTAAVFTVKVRSVTKRKR